MDDAKLQAAGQILGWTIALTLSANPQSTIAQITPDTTLGTESSVVTPNQVIRGLPSDLIDGGAVRGANLFHSFSDFNTLEGRAAYFANPSGVENIISRVTGTNPSNLFGTLGVLGNANLFFLNPNGIIFGSNARLDVRGSFSASTSDRFRFNDGSEFSAINPQVPPLLTVSVPLGLQLGAASSSIINQANLTAGKDLMLHGGSISSPGQLNVPNGSLTVRSTIGDITLRYLTAQTATLSSAQNLNLTESQLVTKGDLTLLAQDTVRVRDTVDRPILIGAGGQLLVESDRAIDIFALNHRDSHFVSGHDMILRSSTPVGGDARYWSGGNFRVEQLNGDLGKLFSPYDPIIRARGDVALNGYEGFSLHILAGGQVDLPNGVLILGAENFAADALIETVTLSDGSRLDINGLARPTLDVRAGTLDIGGAPGIFDTPFPPFIAFLPFPNPLNPIITSANINISNVDIRAADGVVLLTNHYAPNLNLPKGDITVNGFNGIGIRTNFFGGGNSGSVTIDARSSINLNAPINTSSTTDVAGDVKLLAKNNIVSNAQIDTRSSAGNAGQVTLQARENIFVNQSIRTDVRAGSTGNSGNIQVNAPQIMIQTGAQLSANTFSSGAGGNIQINARQLTLQSNAQVSSITGDDLRNNPIAISNTGQGGNISITSDVISLQNQSFIFAQTNQLSSGSAGNLSITANQLNLQNGSFISGATLGQGRGSTVRLDIADTLTFTGTDTENTQTGIFLNSFNSGNAGSLEILNARQLIVQGGALISASASATGQAGNISINLPDGIVHVTGVSNNPERQTASSILSETQNSGRAGDIRVNARQVLIQDGGQISAQTIATGQAGTLAINASERVEISGANGIFNSRLFFNSADVGNAGGIRINTDQLMLRDSGQIAVSGTGTGVSGNIEITADSISLINRGKIQAKTNQSEGGNIFLRLSNQRVSLYMENNSEITAEAFRFANAGNITIDARGVILSRSLADNNDIVANAILGRGGRIEAAATLILNFRLFQEQRTPESDFKSFSENPFFPGELLLNTEESPNQTPLPEDPLPNLMQPACQPGTRPGQRSEFVIRGLGGIPSRPDDAMSSEAIAVGLATPIISSEQQATNLRDNSTQSPELVEARQFVKLPDGTIALVAPTTAAPALPSLGCQAIR